MVATTVETVELRMTVEVVAELMIDVDSMYTLQNALALEL